MRATAPVSLRFASTSSDRTVTSRNAYASTTATLQRALHHSAAAACHKQVFNIMKLLSLPCMPARSTASSNAGLVWVFREFQYSGKEILEPPKGKCTPKN